MGPCGAGRSQGLRGLPRGPRPREALTPPSPGPRPDPGRDPPRERADTGCRSDPPWEGTPAVKGAPEDPLERGAGWAVTGHADRDPKRTVENAGNLLSGIPFSGPLEKPWRIVGPKTIPQLGSARRTTRLRACSGQLPRASAACYAGGRAAGGMTSRRLRRQIPFENDNGVRFKNPSRLVNLMAARKAGVLLVEASADRIVVDTKVGRVIIEPESVRFHRSGRGRGRVLLSPDRSD